MALHEFEVQLVTLLPKMRIWALALTRNGSAADDLVQEAAVKALAAYDSFLAGTNFGAWIHRILLNSFITGMRSRRFIADAEVPDQVVASDHTDRIALCELALAMDLLPREQKAALFSIAVDERSYVEYAHEFRLRDRHTQEPGSPRPASAAFAYGWGTTPSCLRFKPRRGEEGQRLGQLISVCFLLRGMRLPMLMCSWTKCWRKSII